MPNFAMSLNDMRYIRSATDKPLDVHLMIEHPNTHINLFLNSLREGDTVYIHPEAEYHPSTTLQKIIDAGLIPGIAINPGTSIETVMEMLQIVDKVLVMSVIKGDKGIMILDNNVYDMSENMIIEYANKLADAIECNQLLEEYNSGQLTYEYLIAMFLATQAMENGDKLYNYCYDAVIACGKRNIDFKLKQNEKIKVAFLPISAAEWPAEYIYRKLEEDTRFEPVVIPVPLIGRPKNERGKVYTQTYDFFANGNYNVKKVYNAETEEIVGWDDIGGMPDIVVHVTPWYLNIAKDYQVGQYPVHVLNVYISYGVTLGNSIDGTYAEKCLYNKEFVNIMWKVYTETNTNYECYLAKKYKDNVSFIFKPHPNLRNGLIENGYMKSVDEYETYLDEFRKLPNASVCEEGDYLALFDTSDGIINDSISFIGEYLYVDKPMLFLERPEQCFDELGMALVKAHYKACGEDYMGIDNFVNDVVMKMII